MTDMTPRARLTKKEKALIRENIAAMGVAGVTATLHRGRPAILRYLEREKIGHKKVFSPEQQRRIRELAVDSFPAEIARLMGLRAASVSAFMKRNGIEFSQEAKSRHLRKKAAERSPDWYRRIGCKRREIFRKEKLRVKYGIAQKTKLHVDRYSRRLYGVRYRLSKLGYMFENPRRGGDIYSVWYDEETCRSPREDYYAKEYKIRFMPLAN